MTQTLVFEVDAECHSCKGTGIYAGAAERNGAGVVCRTCGGSGCEHITVNYTPFSGRKGRNDIWRVFQANPGIIIGECPERGVALSNFGGMPYWGWFNGAQFGPGTEDRQHTCPAWFYRVADCDKVPTWDECRPGQTFSDCKCFAEKHLCWQRWDAEFGGGVS